MQPIHRYLDHAVLKPELTPEEAQAAIEQGIHFNTRTVCVRPCDIELAQSLCRGTDTQVCTVLGFPHGSGLPASKATEANEYAERGVAEVDMVANIGLIRSSHWSAFQADVAGVIDVLKPAGIILKVILETALLDVALIKASTRLCAELGVDYVKTSTGFNGGGATVEAVAALIEAAEGRVKVKASGGIRDLAQARKYLEMGCERLGVGYTTTPALCGESAPSDEADY